MADYVYVGSGVGNLKAARNFMDHLEERGIMISYDWTKHGSVKTFGHNDQVHIALEEVEGVLNADAVAILLPGGKGTHVEIGLALAQDKYVFMYVPSEVNILDEDFCNFYNHPHVKIYSDLDLMLEDLNSW